ncbi:hypothetical protein C8J56DRAFT_1157605 [Mycena floridula]|nr:hypothetical protein C8J56DRAFT_1157605 [Mycena floridula]
MATTAEILRHLLGNSIFAQLSVKYPEPSISLVGHSYIITGSNTGLGLELAIHLARLNADHIILAVRSIEKGNIAKERILGETNFTGHLEVWELDMGSFASVIRFAEKARKELDRLDGAALNAGVAGNGFNKTEDGWELTFQVNGLSTGLLAILLLPLLNATINIPSPPGSTKLAPHLTITGSGGQNIAKFHERHAPKILDALNDEALFSSFDRYPTSKLFNYLCVQGIAKLPQAQGVVVNVVDPGMNHSELPRNTKINIIGRALIQLLAWPASKGALNILYGLTEASATGEYISRTRATSVSKWLTSEHGEEVQRKVWGEMVEVWKDASSEVEGILQ